MMDEKQLELEYRNMKRQAAPDLWDRIEKNLKEHPERVVAAAEPQKGAVDKTVSIGTYKRQKAGRTYGMAAAAAAVLVLVAALPAMRQRLIKAPEMSGSGMAAETEAAPETWAEGESLVTGGGAAGDGAVSGNEVAGDSAASGAGAAEDSTASGPGAAGHGPVSGNGVAGDSTASGPGAAGHGPVSGNSVAGDSTASGTGGSGDSARMEAAFDGSGIHSAAEDMASGASIKNGDAKRGTQMAYRPLAVPEQAVTVEEDSRYFSEDILGDTSLLCGGRVLSAALEEDESGRTARVVYEMEVDGIYYAEDYVSSMERITVESPIIQTEGDTAFVLYQLVPGETYLLPLLEADDRYELLYPFAPQIQMTGEQEYLFHSGYASLVTQDTSVAVKTPEGTNDYYYDRMLVREDGNFLSDLVSLIEREAQGRK
ncbi:MAG: hypothetical protein HFG64_01560 [Lachnospiraceae bacterium]|nr:hypothetical protein [Lachnospiraceae bacterium]